MTRWTILALTFVLLQACGGPPARTGGADPFDGGAGKGGAQVPVLTK